MLRIYLINDIFYIKLILKINTYHNLRYHYSCNVDYFHKVYEKYNYKLYIRVLF